MLHFNSHRKLTGGLVALSLFAASVHARAADYAPIDCGKASSSGGACDLPELFARSSGSPHGDVIRRRDVAGCDGAARRYRRRAADMAEGNATPAGTTTHASRAHINPVSPRCRLISTRLHHVAHFDERLGITWTLSAEPIPAY
jgi:hypothetical protein